jgi:hypothetical protein
MTPTRPWTLLAVAAVCALLSWMAIRMTFPQVPQLPWTPALALLVLAVAEAITGRNLRARIMGRRHDGKQLHAIGVVRTLALAKASSLGGAVFAGLSFGSLGYSLGLVSLPVAATNAVSTGLTFGAAILLIAAALYLEHCCRAPSSGSENDPDRQ